MISSVSVQGNYNNEFSSIPDYPALCDKVSSFSDKILDTFGGVNSIANLAIMSDVERLDKYLGSWGNRSLTAPIMLGFDRSENPFLVVRFLEKTIIEGFHTESEKKTAVLYPKENGIWHIFWRGNVSCIDLIGKDENINYHNLKKIVMGDEIETGYSGDSNHYKTVYKLAQKNLNHTSAKDD